MYSERGFMHDLKKHKKVLGLVRTAAFFRFSQTKHSVPKQFCGHCPFTPRPISGLAYASIRHSTQIPGLWSSLPVGWFEALVKENYGNACYLQRAILWRNICDNIVFNYYFQVRSVWSLGLLGVGQDECLGRWSQQETKEIRSKTSGSDVSFFLQILSLNQVLCKLSTCPFLALIKRKKTARWFYFWSSLVLSDEIHTTTN